MCFFLKLLLDVGFPVLAFFLSVVVTIDDQAHKWGLVDSERLTTCHSLDESANLPCIARPTGYLDEIGRDETVALDEFLPNVS